MSEVIDLDGTKITIVELTEESRRQIEAVPNGPEIVPQGEASLAGWETK